LIVCPALAFATAVAKADAEETVIAFVKLGSVPSRYAVIESNVFVVVLVTTAVATDCAVAEPTEFVAVTVALRVSPTWAVPSAKVEDVAPEIAAHEPPLELQSSHW
jgi:hypothetical protein